MRRKDGIMDERREKKMTSKDEEEGRGKQNEKRNRERA